MKLSKILIILGIGCAAGLLLVFGVKLQAQNRPDRDAIMAKMGEMNPDIASKMAQFRNRQQDSNRDPQNRSNSEESKANSDFYQTIVDNNIFRPLGWKPPNKEPEYSWIGTTVKEDAAMSQALIRERRSDRLYIAKIGENVGDAVVKEIKEKEIILDKDGETITLRGGKMEYLKSGGSNRSSSRSNERNDDNNDRSSPRTSNRDALAKEKAEKEAQLRQERQREEMRRRFEGARERMMREFRSRGGFRGRR